MSKTCVYVPPKISMAPTKPSIPSVLTGAARITRMAITLPARIGIPPVS